MAAVLLSSQYAIVLQFYYLSYPIIKPLSSYYFYRYYSCLNSYLEAHLDAYLDAYLDTCLDTYLDSR